MTVKFDPQSILHALWKATTKPGYRFPYGLRAEYERYDIASWEKDPQFKAYRYDLYRITRFVEEEGGTDSDKLLGHINEGEATDYSVTTGPGVQAMTFVPDPSLSISDAAAVIMDCKKAGIPVYIPTGSDLSKLINTAAVLAEK